MCTHLVDNRLGCCKTAVAGLLAQGAKTPAYRGTYPIKS